MDPALFQVATQAGAVGVLAVVSWMLWAKVNQRDTEIAKLVAKQERFMKQLLFCATCKHQDKVGGAADDDKPGPGPRV